MPSAQPPDPGSCVFCRIVAGELDAPIVHDGADMIGFLDHRPVFKGHVLLAPRSHVVTLPDLPDALLTPYFTLVRRVSAVLPASLGAQGTFVAVNNVVSQSVPHLHTHVVPRTKGDGLRGFFWPRTRYADGEAEQVAARIRTALES
ncbi:histidine triad (HIT) family protein [Mumia flava]|uniref:Histidine triad (HIT) family protein n=1 Tax=Mumia flava TaxID=1348852 RepID=A0A0B2BQB2_9ACTN|nr:HIT family protein [Mumia flava]PJJ53641.1 histidine triad (HIT) family protein [Mumia flava]